MSKVHWTKVELLALREWQMPKVPVSLRGVERSGSIATEFNREDNPWVVVWNPNAHCDNAVRVSWEDVLAILNSPFPTTLRIDEGDLHRDE